MSDRVTITLDRADAEWWRQVMEFSGGWGHASEAARVLIAVRAALDAAPDAPAEPLALDFAEERLFEAMRDHLDIEMCRSILAEDDMRWSGPTVEAKEALRKVAQAMQRAAGEEAGA